MKSEIDWSAWIFKEIERMDLEGTWMQVHGFDQKTVKILWIWLWKSSYKVFEKYLSLTSKWIVL